MAGVDALLNLVVAQGADALSLVAGETPALIKGGSRRDLSMPPLLGEIFRRFVEEVRASSSEGRYVFSRRGEEITFLVEWEGERSMAFRRADSLAPAVGEPGPGSAVGRSDAPPGGGVAHGRDSREVSSPLAPADSSRLVGLVERALEVEAIDLFLSTASGARMRVQRDLEEIDDARCRADEILALVELTEAQQIRLQGHGSVDLSIDFEAGRVRANVFRHQDGLAAVLRPIGRRIRSLAELGLPSDLAALVEQTDGLVLMVGPTGSGKSSTLAALVDHLNRTRARHVVTIEDPVEFQYSHQRCLIHQREVGCHVESFAAGLRAALREGPDVILVGEMRDPETIAAALTAAETGHLVLSTLHSGGAAMAIDRIIDSFAPHQQSQVRWQLAHALRAIVTQFLLPSTRPGRLVPALEKMIVTHAVAASIREGRGHHIASQIQTGREDGMVSLERSLARLVLDGALSRDVGERAARNPQLLRELLRG